MNNEKKNIFFDLYNMLKLLLKKRAHSIPIFKNNNFCSLRQFKIHMCNYILFLNQNSCTGNS